MALINVTIYYLEHETCNRKLRLHLRGIFEDRTYHGNDKIVLKYPYR